MNINELMGVFSCLKSRGFNFEDTHIIILERIEKLFELLTLRTARKNTQPLCARAQ